MFSQERHGIVTADIVGRVVPCVLITGDDRGVVVNCLVDGQVQRHDRVAALFGQERCGIVAADCVGCVVPSVLITGDDRGVAVNCIIDGQVQGHN